MPSRHLAAALLVWFAAALAACSDSASPKIQTTSIRINMCPYGVVWAAYQNQGAAWVKTDVGTDGTIMFDATDKVSFAYVLAGGSVAYTLVYNTTVAELQAVNDMPCQFVYGIGTVNGTAGSLTGTQVADIAGGYSIASSSAASSSWVLRDLPTASSVDVLGLRFPTATATVPDMAILRRGVLATSIGTAIGALDFGAAEAFALETATATLSGVGSDALYVGTDVSTANITNATLATQYFPTAPASANFVSLPVSARISTDRHELYAYAISGTNLRAIIQYYVAPSAKSFTFGPALGTASVTTVATSPYLRLKATVASQPEYASGVRADFYQQPTPTSLREVLIYTSAGYLGGVPATWEVEIPNFIAAYQGSWGLANAQYAAQVATYQGQLRFEGRPADGTTIMMALRNFSASPLVASSRAALVKRMAMP